MNGGSQEVVATSAVSEAFLDAKSYAATHLLGPEMTAGAGVDELRVDAHDAAYPAHAALEHVPHAELAADLPRIDRFALERERSVSRRSCPRVATGRWSGLR
jgi:hypothetical protein